jgi:hypothetical protein
MPERFTRSLSHLSRLHVAAGVLSGFWRLLGWLVAEDSRALSSACVAAFRSILERHVHLCGAMPVTPRQLSPDPADASRQPPRMSGTTRSHRRTSKGWLDILEALYAESWNPQLGRFRSRFAYRGVPAHADALETALARLAGDHGDVARIELGLLRSFRKYALADAHCTNTIWHWLALAQHAGLPTRLLDWTYSPLVALHFATVRLEQFDQDGEVWCVDFPRVNKLLPRRLRQLLDTEQSEALTVDMLQGFETLHDFDRLGRSPFVVFVEPPTVHPRVAAQHALFSLMPNPTARLDQWLMRHPDVYRRVVIPAALKWEIRDKLDQANINERVLHGGLDGLSRWLARYYRPGGRHVANATATPRIAKHRLR